jgi:hypothetical protein
VDLAAVKAALERAAQQSVIQPTGELAEARSQEMATAPTTPIETLSERDIAAAREALPALQERLGQTIQRHFDAESFKRLLTNHPEFRKD